jgi:hypothetical protein
MLVIGRMCRVNFSSNVVRVLSINISLEFSDMNLPKVLMMLRRLVFWLEPEEHPTPVA